MRGVGKGTVEAARAADDPPKSLAAFSVTPIKPDDGPTPLPWVSFNVGCKSCGHQEFEIASFPIIAPDPSPYYGVASGDTLLRPPHRMKCSCCGSVGTIFDARTDGYDGILNGGCPYESGADGEDFTLRPFKVIVAVTYNIEISELEELASSAQAEIKATDLFDNLSITATCPSGGQPLEFIYECA